MGITVTCSRTANRALRACVVLCASATFAVVPSAAHAHTELATTVPAAATTVRKAPNVVRLVFSEPVTADHAVVLVKNAAGEDMAAGPARDAPPGLAQPIVKLTTPGRYQVVYRVVSIDGHPVAGSYTFRFGPPRPEPSPNGASPAGASPAGPPVEEPAGEARPAEEPAPEADSGSAAIGPLLGGASVAAAIVLGGLVARRRGRAGGSPSS